MALSGRDLKRLARKPLTAAIDKIDFVKILERIAGSESGRAWYERTGDSLPAYADQEEIVQRTIELTEAELSSRGESAPLKEIEDNARLISCRYDFDLHVMARTAVMTALDHLFVNEDKSRLFVSADRRELAHLDRLRQARQDNIGVVYLVNHSSHLDEFITDVVLAQLGIGLPLFAAGTNMMATPSVERILMLGS
ncbi:MAG: hypothetical protein KKB20_07215, partial [Proteobacteria bacterium]|nr:hypothetical protein [Pseudomonadota bacterium]